MDNVLRPILVGEDTKVTDYVVLISTLDDMTILGFNGFHIRPIVAAMFMAAWDVVARAHASGTSAATVDARKGAIYERSLNVAAVRLFLARSPDRGRAAMKCVILGKPATR